MSTLIALAGVAGALLVGGCAVAPYTVAELDGLVVCEKAAMDQVERNARRNNTQIYWRNCPTGTLRVVSANDATKR
jgi:hypothetical protein